MNEEFNNQNNQNNNESEPIHFEEWEMKNPYSQNGAYNSGYNNSWSDFTVSEDTEVVFIDEPAERNNLSRIGFGYAAFSVISTAISILIINIVALLYPDFYETTLFLNLVTPVSLYLFALPVLLIVLSKSDSTALAKRKMGVGQWLIFLVVGFGCMYIGAFMGDGIMDALSKLMNYDYSNALTSIIDENNLLVTAIFTVIVAPIGEELVFRKLIIDRTHKYGGWFCVVLSALMFGLMHGNFYQFFYCFLLGLILGYMYYSTGKIYLTMLMHAVINFFGSIVSSWLAPVTEKLAELDMTDMDAYMQFVSENAFAIICALAFSLFVYAAMICAVVFPVAFRKKIKLGRGEMHLSRSQIVRVACANAGIITMIAIYVVEFVIALIPQY